MKDDNLALMRELIDVIARNEAATKRTDRRLAQANRHLLEIKKKLTKFNGRSRHFGKPMPKSNTGLTYRSRRGP